MTVKNFTTTVENPEEIDYILYNAISNLSPEKRTYLLEWVKKEFPELNKD